MEFLYAAQHVEEDRCPTLTGVHYKVIFRMFSGEIDTSLII
jgi:hypothetical protein